MKAVIIYTVTREIQIESPDELASLPALQEPGEYLYGGSGGEEIINVQVAYYDAAGNLVTPFGTSLCPECRGGGFA